MGTYQVDMVFPEATTFPFGFPKFGIFVKYYEDSGAHSDDLQLRVLFPGEEIDNAGFKLDFPRKDIVPVKLASASLESDQQRVLNVTVPILLSPVQFNQEGFVKVRMVGENRVTNLGSLNIRKVKPNENLTFA